MMPEEISRRKHFIINAVYITILIIIAGIIFLSARFIMPFWIALFLAAIMQPLTRFLGRKIHIKKKHLATLVCFFFLFDYREYGCLDIHGGIISA